MITLTYRSSTYHCPECNRHWQAVTEYHDDNTCNTYVVGDLFKKLFNAQSRLCPECAQLSLFRSYFPNLETLNHLSISPDSLDSQEQDTDQKIPIEPSSEPPSEKNPSKIPLNSLDDFYDCI